MSECHENCKGIWTDLSQDNALDAQRVQEEDVETDFNKNNKGKHSSNCVVVANYRIT